MNNIVQEICKNLALCGISSLTLQLKSDEKSSYLLYSSLEHELRDINLTLNVNYLTREDILDLEPFDFIIACGHPDVIQYSQINKLARISGKYSLLCFESELKFFLLNDFLEFTINAQNGLKLVSFPSFEDVINKHSASEKSTDFKELFYDAINSNIFLS